MAMAGARAAAASTIIINCIFHCLAIGLRLTKMCIDFESDGGANETVFENFLLADKLVTCFKLFIAAYGQVHTDGFGMFAASSLIGMSLHLFTIVIHLYRNHRSRARAWISGMAILVTAGAFMLATKIPEDHAWHWHMTAVQAILDFFVCLEVLLFVRSKMSEHGDGSNDNLLRDLLMILAETIITMYLFVDYLGKTHSPWNAQKILHLVGSCLSVLFGLCQIVWIAYKAYTRRVSAGGEEQAVRATTHNDGRGDEGEEVAPEEVLEVAVALPA